MTAASERDKAAAFAALNTYENATYLAADTLGAVEEAIARAREEGRVESAEQFSYLRRAIASRDAVIDARAAEGGLRRAHEEFARLHARIAELKSQATLAAGTLARSEAEIANAHRELDSASIPREERGRAFTVTERAMLAASKCPTPSNWIEYAKNIFSRQTNTGSSYPKGLPAMRAEYERRSGHVPAPVAIETQPSGNPGSLPAPPPVDERPELTEWRETFPEELGRERHRKIVGHGDHDLPVMYADDRGSWSVWPASGRGEPLATGHAGRAGDGDKRYLVDAEKAADNHPTRIARYRLPGGKAP